MKVRTHQTDIYTQYVMDNTLSVESAEVLRLCNIIIDEINTEEMPYRRRADLADGVCHFVLKQCHRGDKEFKELTPEYFLTPDFLSDSRRMSNADLLNLCTDIKSIILGRMGGVDSNFLEEV